MVLGLGIHLQGMGLKIGYGKPLGTFTTQQVPDAAPAREADVEFVRQVLHLPDACLRPTLIQLDKHAIRQRLQGKDETDYQAYLRQYLATSDCDLTLVEGSANPEEGAVFGLSLLEIGEILDAPILLVARYEDLLVADRVLVAKQRLGDRLLGVAINDIPTVQFETAMEILRPFLEDRGIPVFALMPENRILRSVSVEEVVEKLEAKVVCAPEHLSLADIMVEDLKIGAMDVNSAQLFFRKSTNKAVVTGSNRIDLQLAALETSTACLILTGHAYVSEEVMQRAKEYDVPILSVTKDTLTTVEIVEGCLGQVRLQGGIKVQSVREMMAERFDFNRLLAALNLRLPLPT